MAASFPETHDLGELVSEHGTGGVVAPIIGILFGLALLCGSLGMITLLKDVIDGGYAFVVCLFGALSVVLSTIGLFTALRNRGLKVTVYEQGLVHTDGKEAKVYRWDDIDVVLQSITRYRRSTVYLYTVRHKDGTVLSLNSNKLKDVPKLGEKIQKEVSLRLLPRYSAALEAGGIAKFGPLTLSKDGINNGEETVPWDQVEGVRISGGTITVKKEGKWRAWSRIRSADVPNLLVFLTLVDQIVGVNK